MSGQNHGRGNNRKHKPKNNHIILKLFIVLCLFVLAGFMFVRINITKTNYQPYKTDYARAADVMSSRLVKNILLIGTDERTAGESSRSDAIIVVSINSRTRKLIMTSILRDCYVNIPGHGQTRINSAYQKGGAALLIQTIEENFKIGIDNYIKVDFYSFMNIIDCMGGVEITVTQEELNLVNGYISEINHIIGAPEGDQFLDSAGTFVLNGRQALAYSRIRYVGTDFERTNRQRTVLNALFSKAKSASPVKLYEAFQSILPDITTDIDDNELTLMLFEALIYRSYEAKQLRIPADKTWQNYDANGQQVLKLDFDANIKILQQEIYEE